MLCVYCASCRRHRVHGIDQQDVFLDVGHRVNVQPISSRHDITNGVPKHVGHAMSAVRRSAFLLPSFLRMTEIPPYILRVMRCPFLAAWYLLLLHHPNKSQTVSPIGHRTTTKKRQIYQLYPSARHAPHICRIARACFPSTIRLRLCLYNDIAVLAGVVSARRDCTAKLR